jgi:hypothetical protein
MGTSNSFPGLTLPGREVAHSPAASAVGKKTWIYRSTPHTPSWCNALLVKHRDNFALPLLHFKQSIRMIYKQKEAFI